VQSGHKGEWSYVQWVLLLLVLPYTRVLAVGVKAFKKGSESQVSFEGWCVCVDILARSVCVVSSSSRSSLDVAPASPFIVSKERARVTFVIKRWK
jgi:hypothetical protein